MVQCSTCLKQFKYQCELSRHNKRKYPCKEIKTLPYDACRLPYDACRLPYDAEANLYDAKKSPVVDPKECVYCKYKFTQTCNTRRHEQVCKENDKLRNLEMNLCIPLDKYHEKDCRFCNKEFTRRFDMIKHYKSCNARDMYMDTLLEKHKVEHCKTLNNVSITNNSNNNINHDNRKYVVINSLDKTHRIMQDLPQKVAQWLIHDQRQSSGKHMDWETGMKMILKTHEEPENRNLKVTSDRSNVIWCYDGKKDAARPSDAVIREAFQNCLDDLLHIQEKHYSTLLSLGVLRELESYIDTVSTREHAKQHSKAVMTGLRCFSE